MRKRKKRKKNNTQDEMQKQNNNRELRGSTDSPSLQAESLYNTLGELKLKKGKTEV
jgi:hypothetical protein